MVSDYSKAFRFQMMVSRQDWGLKRDLRIVPPCCCLPGSVLDVRLPANDGRSELSPGPRGVHHRGSHDLPGHHAHLHLPDGEALKPSLLHNSPFFRLSVLLLFLLLNSYYNIRQRITSRHFVALNENCPVLKQHKMASSNIILEFKFTIYIILYSIFMFVHLFLHILFFFYIKVRGSIVSCPCYGFKLGSGFQRKASSRPSYFKDKSRIGFQTILKFSIWVSCLG